MEADDTFAADLQRGSFFSPCHIATTQRSCGGIRIAATRRAALILDFDETLLNDSTSALLESHGISVSDFWKVRHARLIDEGFDPTEAYLMLLVKEFKALGKLDELRPEKLREFGATLDFHPGVLEMFDELRAMVPKGCSVHFFVISGGLQDIISGSKIASKLDDFWGCTFHWDQDLGVPYPKNVVSFTEKTKYIFQINKGLIGKDHKNKPYEVNEYMDLEKKWIPLENMIYVGDGLTDVACFSLLGGSKKATSIVVYNKAQKRREGIQNGVKLARFGRGLGPFKADYRAETSLRELLNERIVEIVEGAIS